jgi:hypothetical protein
MGKVALALASPTKLGTEKIFFSPPPPAVADSSWLRDRPTATATAATNASLKAYKKKKVLP